jgi:ferric-dicitrate binding protein FerR (iron transport regulator)
MGDDAMNACQQTQALLFEKADGRIDPTVRSNLDAHLAICPHCQQVYAMWSGALPRLRGLPTPELSAVSLRRMENEVLRQLPGTAAPRARRTLWLALAAGFLLLAGVGALALRTPTSPAFARIQTMWGHVTLSGAAMTPGADMGPGAVLEIAAAGEASFLVGRAAEVRLFGPGEVAFDGTAGSPRLRLSSGRLAVHIAHRRAGESFTVATAHGRVEVRGTRFVVGYEAQGSYVHVDEGEVLAFRTGTAAPFVVKAGETFSFTVTSPEPAPAPTEAPPAEVAPRVCPKSSCSEAGARARKAMRRGNPGRAIEVVDEALGQAADCAPGSRCLDELGYLRAEALRQAGRLEAAVSAYRSLDRPGATRAMRQNALYAAAQLERRLGRAADARRSFEHAYAAHPGGALAEEALAALLEMLEPGSQDAHAAAERYLGRYPQGMAAGRARRILSGAPGAH